ncbi:MAG: ATP-grasp domain-containing protein [Flavisolibacter sp.]
MKKIGVLFGRERSFPMAFIERVNSKNIDGITAEPVHIDKAMQGDPSGYAVIIDRISQDVPFYRTWLKNAALTGTSVINNPFWWSADDKYFNNCLMTQVDVPIPKTVILPSYELPTDTTSESFSNLAYPLDWEGIFNYVGFPAYMKPYSGGGWKNVYRLENMDEFYQKHKETEQLVMLLQEEIVFDEYYRCYCIGRKHVRIMAYDPRNPHHLRYQSDFKPSPEKQKEMEEIVLRINHYLGYDFNTVELALRDGIPYAIDFGNPAPDAERAGVGEENFEWVVETAASYAIEQAQKHKEGQLTLTWGEFVKRSAAAQSLIP